MALFFVVVAVLGLMILAFSASLASGIEHNRKRQWRRRMAFSGSWRDIDKVHNPPRFDLWTPAIILAGSLIWCVLALGWYQAAFGSERDVTFRVVGKERIAEKGDGKSLVYADDGETYENTDALFHGKVNSTDLQRDLVVGQYVVCKINGYRFGLFSMYPNLLECRDANTGRKLRS